MSKKPLKSKETVREAVGVFSNAETLQAALDDLEENGFMHHELSILADAKAIEEKLGHVYKRVEDIEDDPKAPRIIFVANETIGEAMGSAIGLPIYIASVTATGIVVAAGGPLFTVIATALAAGLGGASIGYILAALIEKHHADYIESQIRHGGLLLWVNLRSKDMEERAQTILKRHSARDVHIHEIPLYG